MNNEQFYLNIFDHSSIAYSVVEVVLDEDGHAIDWIYRYCNQAFADTKEYRIDAMIDHSYSSLFPEADEKWLQVYYRAAYENKSSELDSMLGEQTCHVTVMPIGKRGYCSCMIQQTDKGKYETRDDSQPGSEGAGQENEKYVLDKLYPEYVSVYRIELNSGQYEILRLADTTNAKKIAGDDPHPFGNFDEYVRRYTEAFIVAEDKQEFSDWFACKNMKKRLCREDKITYHYKSISEDGRQCFYEAYGVKGKVSDDEFMMFLGFRNIDSILYKERAIQEELKRTVKELSVRNEIIASIARTYQYISRIDIRSDHYEEIVNKTNTQFRLSRSGLISESSENVCKDMIAEEYQEAFLKFVDISTLPQRMGKEETIVIEYRMKDGNWHTLRFIEKKRDENGQLTHVLCAVRSISATKKRERNLVYLAEEAKRDAALKTRFLSNMSHDIKTPMNGIIGMIKMADRYPEDIRVQKKCRDRVMESMRYLVSLVNDILDINKLESGELLHQEIAFDLTQLLFDANTDKQKQAAEKDIEYIVDWEKADLQHVHLIGNPIYLERLLSVISDNAIKFTKPGGIVRVWCVEKAVDNERVVFEFGCADTGIGMSEEFLAYAFDMFSQENETGRSKYEGTGLGLAIARKLADRLGGTIQIDSKKDVGTTVLMTIPFQLGEEQETRPMFCYDELSVEGCRVLVVEDNELNMEIAKFMLEENGVSVECAGNGLEAAEKFAKAPQGYYDMIFMDIMMPKLNGWDATRRIRTMKREDAATIPIIAMSANSFADDIINSRISGMNLHLTKPLDEAKLLQAMKECIGNTMYKGQTESVSAQDDSCGSSR